MALGDTTEIYPDIWAIELKASDTTTDSIPSAASDGILLADLWAKIGGVAPDTVEILVVSTAGSDTMTVTSQLWWGFGVLAGLTYAWAPAGIGNHSTPTAGVLNGGAAIVEAGADVIRHCETVDVPAHAVRAYARITAIGGTSTAVTHFLIARKRYGRA